MYDNPDPLSTARPPRESLPKAREFTQSSAGTAFLLAGVRYFSNQAIR
jgi:hypothetical protein